MQALGLHGAQQGTYRETAANIRQGYSTTLKTLGFKSESAAILECMKVVTR
jgi:hypothetical protein